MIEFIGPLYKLVTTVHKSLSDWSLASSDHTTPPAELTALHALIPLDHSDFVIWSRGGTHTKYNFQQYPAGLPLRCLAMNGLLLLRAGMSRACLPSRCLEMGLWVTI
jgi:hypothetical protein